MIIKYLKMRKFISQQSTQTELHPEICSCLPPSQPTECVLPDEKVQIELVDKLELLKSQNEMLQILVDVKNQEIQRLLSIYENDIRDIIRRHEQQLIETDNRCVQAEIKYQIASRGPKGIVLKLRKRKTTITKSLIYDAETPQIQQFQEYSLWREKSMQLFLGKNL